MTDDEILDDIAALHAGDYVIAACIAEIRNAPADLSLIDKMALVKKLGYAVSTKAATPVPTPLAHIMSQRVH